MLKADFHLHTKYSPDSGTTLEQVINRCQEIGINCLAVTDHGTAAGAIEMKKIAPFTIIVAEEVLTTAGDMIGLFLSHDIPNGLSPKETAIRIKQQGGMICIPHPFSRLHPSAMPKKVVEEIISYIDIIEVFNSRSSFLSNTDKIKRFAQEHGLIASAGSDAHTVNEIGNAYVEMPEFNGRDDFLQALSQGNIVGHRTNPLVRVSSVKEKFLHKFFPGR
ncbi:MAG: PHP domain-containing protein [Dehalococcoidia bacterium]|nr:PHP domain-containing protein [Dehalococcoidia bacterium]